MHKNRDELLAYLDQLQLEYQLHEHAAVYTVDEARVHCGSISGCHCKNLFLRTRKKKNWLIVLQDDTEISLKQIAGLLGEGGFSFASPARLLEYLGVEPGSVTPFSVINDTGHAVNVAIESRVMQSSVANFHPLVNTATVSITPEHLLEFMRATGHEPLIIDCTH